MLRARTTPMLGCAPGAGPGAPPPPGPGIMKHTVAHNISGTNNRNMGAINAACLRLVGLDALVTSDFEPSRGCTAAVIAPGS